MAVPGPAALQRLNGPQASPASSPSSLPLAGSQEALWLCPEDNWTQFPHWHFRGPGHHGVGQDWFRKECSFFLENYKHSGPRQPGPAPLPPCFLGSPVPVCGRWAQPHGIGHGCRQKHPSSCRAGTRGAAGRRAAPPGPRWLWLCGWAPRSPPVCPATAPPCSQARALGAEAARGAVDGSGLLTWASSRKVMFGHLSKSSDRSSRSAGRFTPIREKKLLAPWGGRGLSWGGCTCRGGRAVPRAGSWEH